MLTEETVGIEVFLHQVDSGKRFQGILKHRFSDFIVREVDLQGVVLHLHSLDGKDLETKYFPKIEESSSEGADSGSPVEERLVVDRINAKLTVDARNKKGSVKAVKDIRQGDEILVNYGAAYRFKERGSEHGTNHRKYNLWTS